MNVLVRITAMIILLLSVPLAAREVGGVNVPEIVEVGGAPLVLNGAGLRTKFFVKVYAGALYLPKLEKDATRVLAHEGPAAVHLHFIHSEVSAAKLVDAWNDGFSANLDATQLAVLKARIDRFNALFQTARKGDVIRLDYNPGAGTSVIIKGETRGTIEGADFFRALLAIWLGKHPADDDLKRSLLGG